MDVTQENISKLEERLQELSEFLKYTKQAFFRQVARTDKYQKRAYTAERRVRHLEKALDNCISAAGHPDAAEGCRNVIRIAVEAQKPLPL